MSRHSRFAERILSVMSTCRQQGRNVWDCLTDCHHAAMIGQPTPSLLPTVAAGRLIA
jgi:transposase